MSRLAVPKTYKLYIGGAFPRSESGRTYEVVSAKGAFLANAAQGIPQGRPRRRRRRARGASSGWSGATAYNRGQVLYRIAELLEGRRAQFVDEIVARRGRLGRRGRAPQVDEAIDRWVWYAGWADKFAQVAGNGNPVAGPYFNISVPEPTGVVGDHRPAGLRAARASCQRRRARARRRATRSSWSASERFPLSAISLAEVLATSDVPGGVVNVLTGSPAEIAPWLASHADVNALDLVGAGDLDWVDLQIAAADTLKRVLPPEHGPDAAAPEPRSHHGLHRDQDRLAHQEPDLSRDRAPKSRWRFAAVEGDDGGMSEFGADCVRRRQPDPGRQLAGVASRRGRAATSASSGDTTDDVIARLGRRDRGGAGIGHPADRHQRPRLAAVGGAHRAQRRDHPRDAAARPARDAHPHAVGACRAGTSSPSEIRDVNRHLWQFAPTVHAMWLDLWPALALEDGELNPAYSDDRLHLNEAGYSAWLAELKPAIERLRQLPPSSRAIQLPDLGGRSWSDA